MVGPARVFGMSGWVGAKNNEISNRFWGQGVRPLRLVARARAAGAVQGGRSQPCIYNLGSHGGVRTACGRDERNTLRRSRPFEMYDTK